MFLQRKDAENRLVFEPHTTTGLRIKRIQQFTDDKIGPWRSKVEVQVVDELPSPPTLASEAMLVSYQSQRISATQDGTPFDPGHMNILPTLQVRGHYIDKLDDSVYYQDNAMYLSPPISPSNIASRAMTTAVLPFFRKSATPVAAHQSLLPRQFAAPELEDLKSDTNFTDLDSFIQEARDLEPSYLGFSTTHSIGFAFPNLKPGDEVWAIDGARVPFILRLIGMKKYRIVSECYLWAALELDYWNPGTKKGKWSEESVPHQEQQTHIIEIH